MEELVVVEDVEVEILEEVVVLLVLVLNVVEVLID